jgi:hypothetical protein
MMGIHDGCCGICRGRVVACAPVLRRRLSHWIRIAVRVGSDPRDRCIPGD